MADYDNKALRERFQDSYGDVLSDSSHPVYLDDNGILRWVPNDAVRWLVDLCRELREKDVFPYGGMLNAMAVADQTGKLNHEDYMEFYRDMGYSLSGFLEIFADDYSS
jgi:hypothetical protein